MYVETKELQNSQGTGTYLISQFFVQYAQHVIVRSDDFERCTVVALGQAHLACYKRLIERVNEDNLLAMLLSLLPNLRS